MATTQETGCGFRFTDADVLESDHVQHLTFGPVWALLIRQCTHNRCFAQPISHTAYTAQKVTVERLEPNHWATHRVTLMP